MKELHELYKAISGIDALIPPYLFVTETLSKVCQYMKFQLGVVYTLDSENNCKPFASNNVSDSLYMRNGDFHDFYCPKNTVNAIKSEEIIVINNPEAVEELYPLNLTGPDKPLSAVIAPLYDRRIQMGFCLLISPEPKAFTELEINSLQYISMLISRAIVYDKSISGMGSAYTKNLEFEIVERRHMESELLQQREELHTIFNSVPAIIFYKDKDCRIIRVNKTYEEELGLPEGVIKNKNDYELFPKKDADHYVKDDMEVITTGHPKKNIVETVVTPKGTRWLRTDKVPYKDENGNILGLIGLSIDITERRAMEEKLRESSETLQALFNASPLAILVIDRSGKITMSNPAAELLFGSHLRDINELFGQCLSKCAEDTFHGLNRQILSGETITGLELQCRRKEGSPFYISLSTAPLHDSEGNIISVMAIISDISQKTKVEIEMSKLNQFLKNIIENANIWLNVLDEKSNVVIWNRAAEQISGYSRDEVIGHKKIWKLLYPDRKSRSAISETLKAIIQDNTPVEDFQTNIMSKDGQSRIMSWNSHRLTGEDGSTLGAIILGIDITERKLAEDEIRYLSFHDKLTGLYNRACFEEELHKINSPEHLPFTLILGDLNGLKLTNDVFGHQKGDFLLMKMAEIIKASCRREDIISRWGGDEFAIIMPKADEETAARTCSRIVENCVKSGENPVLPSIALGAVTKNTVVRDMQQVLKEAEDKMYRNKLLESKSARNAIISSLEQTLTEKSHETEEHTRRMRQMCIDIGHSIGLNSEEIDELALLATLHDIGKIAIPDTILVKPDKLTAEEWRVMRRHPEIGYRIAESSPELSHIADAILTHHERYDGEGYPQGLKGDKIPIISRILAIVDAYDVMTHGRPYKAAMSAETALQELERCAGSQFDPGLVKIFSSMMRLKK